MTGIIITGLTGSGKTQIAFELARKINGEVINLDRTFTWKYFPLSSGMSDVKEQKGSLSL
jgi:tRNA A37 N6-isopentenylltransferase MiaA